jgi:hypothetical protein
MPGAGRLAARKQAFAAAARHFPDAEFSIVRLISSNDDFCDMCEELAEAELALSRVNEASEEIRRSREAEWRALVDRLVAEVAIALRENERPQRDDARR